MKLNKLSLSLAITLALGTTFGIAHAEDTTATTATKAPAATTAAKAPTETTSKATATTATSTTEKSTTSKATTTADNTEKTATTTKAPTAAKTPADSTAKTATATKSTAKTAPKENLPAGVYSDTKDNWAREAIQNMTNAGYFSGYADNTFRPSQTITREQTAAIYGKVLQHNMNEQELASIVTKENSISYSDVESDRWSSASIKLVGAAGVMEGVTSSTFNPAKAMNREEFVASAANLVKKINADAPVKTEKVTFKDEASISKAYAEDIAYMAQRGFVASGSTTDFNPKQAVTRAQAATILNRILNGATAPVSKTTTAKEDVAKAEATTTDAKKSDKDAKAEAKKAEADAKKADKAAKADAKKAESDAKRSAKVAESSTEQTTTSRVVRAPRRTNNLKALDQKQQESLENNVFTELNKTYKTPEAFQDYGVMYWRDNQLHVALKNQSDISTVKANLANRGNTTIDNYVVVEPSQYSQAEYDQIDANFRNYYSKNEKAGNILATFPDVENNQLYAVVSTATKETQQGISKAFGSKVKMTVKR